MKPALIAIAAAVSLTACNQEEPKTASEFYGMQDTQFLACEALLNGSAQMFGGDPQARQVLAEQVNTWAQQAGGELADAGSELVAAAGSALDWDGAVDGFGRECVDLGWPAA